MTDDSRIAGPFIRWLDYGSDGWHPDSFPTIEAAVRADKYGGRSVITRIVDFRIVEAEDASDPTIGSTTLGG